MIFLVPPSQLLCQPVPLGATLTVLQRSTSCVGRYTVTQADLNSGAALVNAQDYPPLPLTPTMRQAHQRRQQLLARADVAAGRFVEESAAEHLARLDKMA